MIRRCSLTAAALAMLLLVPAAEAVMIDLSSPQEGATVYPGDTVELSAVLTNDTEMRDVIRVDVTITADLPQMGEYVRVGSFRVPLEAGESVSEDLVYDIPVNLAVPMAVTGTLEVFAVGLESETEDSDSLTMTLAPLPGYRMSRTDLDIELSSPQEGTTVYPGDRVQLTASVTNNTDQVEVVLVTFSLEADIPMGPMAYEGQIRMIVQPGETVSETFAADLPDHLPLMEEVTVTLTAKALGQVSGDEDVDSLSLTLAPTEPGRAAAMDAKFFTATAGPAYRGLADRMESEQDGGVSIALDSPQEDTTVYPGDMVEISVTVTNDTDDIELILVTFSLSADAPDIPVELQAQFRLVLGAGESVSESLAVELPAELPVFEPVTVTIEATAVGQVSGTEDADALSLTVVP